MPHATPPPSTPTAIFANYQRLIKRARTYLHDLSEHSLELHDDFNVTYEMMEEDKYFLMDAVAGYTDVSSEYTRWENGAIDGEEFVARVGNISRELERVLEWA